MATELKDHSTPFNEIYDESHPDWEAVVEAYTYWWTHKNFEGLDSATAPSNAHTEEDWFKTISLLKNERILRFPPEETMLREESGRGRWSKIWPFGRMTLPLTAGALVLALAVCDDQRRSPDNQTQVPPVVATAAAKGQPPIGIIPPPKGIISPIFAPKPEAAVNMPEAVTSAPVSEAVLPDPECEPGMEIITIEIKREGDSDANRIYRYPNRVNPAGDSAKGLFDKELVNSYVKDNPYSDTAIRYSLRNQRNEGRDVQASDPDLLALLDEARLFYGQPVTDSAYLTWVDSIKRNNPPGTIVGDLINAKEFRSQDPRSLIRRLQAIPRP